MLNALLTPPVAARLLWMAFLRVGGGAGSGNFGHGGRPGEVGGSGEGGGGAIDKHTATTDTAVSLNSEWSAAHGESEGPFWNVEGEKNGQYWAIRDENGVLVAGATTVQRGMMTEIKSIGSHRLGGGTKILDALKAKNIWIVAMSTPQAMRWYQRQGFKKTDAAPKDYNMKWRRAEPRTAGGQGSGNFGHGGRPGEVGGSGEGGGSGTSVSAEKALGQYVVGGLAQSVNDDLRSGNAFSESGNGAVIDHLDTLCKENALEKSATVYRIVPADVVADAQVGQTFTDHGFVSCTFDQAALTQIAEDIGLIDDAAQGIPKDVSIMRIFAPKGSRAINVNKIIGRSHLYGTQKEVILARGTRFRVTSRGGQFVNVVAEQR